MAIGFGRALQADFGDSYHYKAPVVEMISGRIGTTMTLGFLAILFALVVSIPLGTLAAMPGFPSSTASLC